MTDRKRIVITVASALALAVTVVAGQWSVVGSTEARVWTFASLGAVGLTLVGVAFVNRWWALLPAVSTVGILVLAAVVYTPPDPWSYESYSIPPVFMVLWLIFLTALFVAFLSLGLLARWIWDLFRARRASRTKAPEGRPA